ncbi:hypothetical protein [Pararhizobium sp. IMCC21322]|uniref:hypothetical protein n=1 Tax=Pararhizobium sp. IMCC21322 TaxID=3067903 RepID=UPI002740448C|nr:hypothetical protein [Pararhizobium sp. IMCC21322]
MSSRVCRISVGSHTTIVRFWTPKGVALDGFPVSELVADANAVSGLVLAAYPLLMNWRQASQNFAPKGA